MQDSNLNDSNGIDNSHVNAVQDIQKREMLRSIRSDIYFGAFGGALYGGFFGTSGFLILKYVSFLRKHATSNNFIAMTLLCTTIGGFVGSVASGKNSTIRQIQVYSIGNPKYFDKNIERSTYDSYARRKQQIQQHQTSENSFIENEK